jgi:hypothetical protein
VKKWKNVRDVLAENATGKVYHYVNAEKISFVMLIVVDDVKKMNIQMSGTKNSFLLHQAE